MKIGISIVTQGDREQIFHRLLASVGAAADYCDFDVKMYLSLKPECVGKGRNDNGQAMLLDGCRYLFFLDDDIVVPETYIQASIDLMEFINCPMVSGVSKRYIERFGVKFNGHDIAGIPTPKDNFVVRAEDVRAVGGPDRRLEYFDDWDQYCRLRTIRDTPIRTSKDMIVDKPDWRMPGGYQSLPGGRDSVRLNSALTLARQYPYGYAIVNDGKGHDSWTTQPNFRVLRRIQLKNEFNAL